MSGMNRHLEKIKSIHEERRASSVIEHDFPSRKIRKNYAVDFTTKVKQEKVTPKRTNVENEIFRICQATLLSVCVLLLSYHGVRHGQTEYSVMENGEIVQGYVHKAVVTVSLGYSVSYSLVSLVTISMLLYSVVSKRPRWSLPSIILYLADLVCDVGDATVAIWLFFSSFPIGTALFYASGTILLILGEIWVWLGVLRLYEHRTFK